MKFRKRWIHREGNSWTPVDLLTSGFAEMSSGSSEALDVNRPEAIAVKNRRVRVSVFPDDRDLEFGPWANFV